MERVGQRNIYWDNVKGLLILLVVLGHYLILYVDKGVAGPLVSTVYYWIYSFHMPLFVFVSGYFSDRLERGRSKAVFRLLIPFFIFNSLMQFWFFRQTGQYAGPLMPVYVNWYLLALFIWRMLLPEILAIRGILLISFVSAFAVGFLDSINNYLALCRVVAFLPFFILGYRARVDHWEHFFDRRNLKTFIFLVATVSIVYLFGISNILSTYVFIAFPYPAPKVVWLVIRVAYFVLAVCAGFAVLCICPRSHIPILTKAGRNSLLIFLIHRYLTFVFNCYVPIEVWSDWYLPIAVLVSIATLLILGLDLFAKCYSIAIAALERALSVEGGTALDQWPFRRRLILFLVIVNAVMLATIPFLNRSTNSELDDPESSIHPKLTQQEVDSLNSSVTVSFVGDLILLEDQVKHALDQTHGGYDFSPVFKDVQRHFIDSDLTVGVLEVPLAGEEAGYSRSNFDDGIPLYLNGPDAWAQAIKASGIDVVSTSNNHAMDKGVRGLLRTLDVLDELGLDYVGTFREPSAPGRILIKEVQGLKLAFMAYTYGLNYLEKAEVQEFDQRHISILPPLNDRRWVEMARDRIEKDVAVARRLGADILFALPHMGTQFSHAPDRFSRTWAEFMIQSGVDVVLADHSHAVQPVERVSIESASNATREGWVVYCPGNFVNSYTEKNGDASAIVNVHISGKGTVMGLSIVPIWIRRPIGGQYSPVAVYDALNDEHLLTSLSHLDFKRIREVQSTVTEVMLGHALSLDQVQDRYFLLRDGYHRQPLEVRLINQSESPPKQGGQNALHQVLKKARRVLVVGDSISEGTKNGGYPWFEPLGAIYPEAEFINQSKGGATSASVLEKFMKEDLPEADVLILALGVNDVRYRNPDLCSMDAGEFVGTMQRIISIFKDQNPGSSIVVISLWPAYDNDPFCPLPVIERDQLIDEYNDALRENCIRESFLFVDACSRIREFIEPRVTDEYIIDHIHPNANAGIIAYANCVLFGSFDRWAIE